MSFASSSNYPNIHTSAHPPIPIIQESVFTYLLEGDKWRAGSPHDTAYVDATTGQALTRGQVKDLSLRLAWGLRNTIDLDGGNLQRGDMVMLMSANTFDWPVTLFGCVAAGLTTTFAPCSATPVELSWQYLDSKPRIILAQRKLVPVVLEMLKLVGEYPGTSKSKVWVVDGLASGSQAYSPSPSRGVSNCAGLLNGGMMTTAERFDGEDAKNTVYVCYSSGTTGKPKGVLTSHQNVCSVLMMTQALWKTVEDVPYRDGWGGKDVYLAVLPFYHIFGLAMQLHYPLLRSRPSIILPSFSVQGFCSAVQKYRVTSLLLVPPIILEISEFEDLHKYDLSSITNIASGAAALSTVLADKFLGRLRGQHHTPRFLNEDVHLTRQRENVQLPLLIQGCGSTETSCPCQIVRPEQAERKFGSVGELLPNIRARLVEEIEDGLVRDVADGEEGEMWLKGPTICSGYLNRPDANAQTSTRDGWFRTGDILRRDSDGYYWIVDRKKEMLKYKGHQIAPAELEAILMTHPEIADVGVVGVADAYTGNELPRAYIRPTSPSLASSARSATPKSARVAQLEKEIEAWFKRQPVSAYKWLRGGVVVVPEIPKSGTGKILRKELREWVKAENKTRERRGGGSMVARMAKL